MRAGFILMLSVGLSACATARSSNLGQTPTASEILQIKKEGWDEYVRVFSNPEIRTDQPRIPVGSRLKAISNVSCEAETEQHRALGWVRFLLCHFDMEYVSPQGISAVYRSSDMFALRSTGIWTNKVISSSQ